MSDGFTKEEKAAMRAKIAEEKVLRPWEARVYRRVRDDGGPAIVSEP